MKKSIKLIIGFILMTIAYIIFGTSNVEAAGASVTANNKNVNVGDSVTVTVSINAATWSVYVDGAASDSIVGYNQDLSNQSVTKSYNINTSNPGTYTVSISGSVKDADETKVPVSDSTTITVSQKNNDNNGGNTGGNSNTQTPEKTPNFSSTNQTVYATGTVNIRSSYSTSSSVIGSLQEGASITRTGIGDNGWSKVSYNGGTGYISSSYLTTEKKEEKNEDEEKEDEEKNADNTLKSLEVTPNGLSPKFSPSTEKYTLSVNPDVEKLEIKATPTSDKAKVSITGNEKFKAGENTVKITVTSEDGKTKTYTITVKKQEKNSAIGLTSLKLNKYTLTPSFSADVYEYNVSITDANIDKLDLSAIANMEDAKVEITGNENLKSGKNTITITVTSADGENKTVYKIYADIKETKSAAPTTTQTQPKSAKTTKSKLPLYAGIGAIVLLIVLMIIIIVRNKRYNEEYDDEDSDENKEDSQEDLYNFQSKDYGMDDVDNSSIDENNTSSYDIPNKDLNSNTDTYSSDDKKKLREDYLSQFNNYNPYTEDNIVDANENKTEDSYSDLFGSYKDENGNDAETNYQDEYDDYRPRRSKGKHSK